jgi:hypothetical protein
LRSRDDFLRRGDLTAIEKSHVSPLGREQLDDRPADTPAATGDDGDLAAKA